MAITLIGRPDSALTNDIANLIQADKNSTANIIHPDVFLADDFVSGHDAYLITYVYDMARRKEIADKITAYNLTRFTFIHSSATVDKTAIVEPGTFVGPYSMIAFEATIKQDCLLAPYTLVSHRTKIGKGTVTNPGAMIAGAVNVGNYCLLGIRSTTVDQIEICDNVQVGPCAFVTKNITQPGRYLGSPARRG